ncbi:hypothetical protein ACHAXS_001803, partial [Conticribra weissflogii]
EKLANMTQHNSSKDSFNMLVWMIFIKSDIIKFDIKQSYELKVLLIFLNDH